MFFAAQVCQSQTPSPAPDPAKVLMIGDSFIYVFNIPETLDGLTSAGGKHAKFIQHASGNKGLAWHWTNKVGNTTAPEAIAKEHWDLVILEEGNFPVPGDPSLPAYLAEFKAVTAKYKALAAETKTPIMLYPGFIWVKTQQDIKNRLDFNDDLADALGIVCAPTLRAVLNSQKTHPNLAVNDNEKGLKYATLKMGAHQSPYSAYLAACTIYAAIYNQSPVGLKFFKSGGFEIEEADALTAQQVAWETWNSHKTTHKGATRENGLPLNK